MTKFVPSIALIYMGGTFGCTGSPLTPLAASKFLPLIKQLIHTEMPAITYLTSSASIKDSSQLNQQDWIDLITQINQLSAQGYQHFLVIHGTDTLAYTAAFLAEYFAGQSLQLLVTGSQFPLLDASGQHLNDNSDALSNLRLAYQQLLRTPQPNNNCWVAFDKQIWPAATVQKIHTSATPTFTGTLSAINQLNQSQCKNPHLATQSIDLSRLNDLNIAIYYALPISAEQHAAQLQQCLRSDKVQAIIIMAFGSGNLGQHVLIEQVLQQAAEHQVLIVLASQVPFGGVNSRYAAGHWLNQFGVLSAANLPLPAVYARLAYLLCHNLSFTERQEYWQLRLTEQS